MKKSLLLFSLIITTSLSAQVCSDLFISEYVEGPHNNNGIEIYNPTSSPIDLSGYTINRYSNGANSNPESWELSGSIGAGDVIVVGNGQLDSVDLGSYWSIPVDPVFYALLDGHCNGDYDANSTFYFNGDDAMTLEKNGNTIDIFGKVGEDPGSAWTDDLTAGYTDANGGTWWTKRQTLIRKASIQTGVTQNPILFNPTLEYDSLPDATYSNLGSHVCDCSLTSSGIIVKNPALSYVMYPNPTARGAEVCVNANFQVKEIVLTNILGEQIKFNQSINTNSLTKGTYLVDIEFFNGEVVKNKLIVE